MLTRTSGCHRMTGKYARSAGPRGLKYAHGAGQDLPITKIAVEARMEGDGVDAACSPPPGEPDLDVAELYPWQLTLYGLAVLTGISLLCTAAVTAVMLPLWLPWV